jgi:hypothetical protein
MTPELLELLLAVLRADEGCKKKFRGREEELLGAAASMMLAMKGVGGVGRMETTIAKHASPFVQDVVSVEASVERFQLPQTHTPKERALLNKGHGYFETFHEHEDALTTLHLGHRLAAANYYDSGQEVLMRGTCEVRATPLEVISYHMGFPAVYAARKERGRSRSFKMGERR